MGMIIDFHTHIFPEPVRSRRADFFEDEPAFRMLYDDPKARLAGAGDLVDAMDAQGVDCSVVFGFPWRDAQRNRWHNDYIMDAMTRYPGRLVGLGCLDPSAAGAEAEAERCLAGGLAGLGELAFYEGGIDAGCLDRLAPLMDLCRARDRLILIHTNEPVGHRYPGKTPNTLAQIYALVRRFAHNKLVLAHWGGGLFFYCMLKKQVRQALQNVYFDTAASPFLYHPAIYRFALEWAGEQKVLFGSDFPLLPPSRYFREIEGAGLTAGQKARVCGTNAARLLNLQSGSHRGDVRKTDS